MYLGFLGSIYSPRSTFISYSEIISVVCGGKILGLPLFFKKQKNSALTRPARALLLSDMVSLLGVRHTDGDKAMELHTWPGAAKEAVDAATSP